MIKKFCHEDNDLTSVKRVKLMVLLVSAWCSICGIAWSGIYYLVFGFSLTTLLPLLFAIVVIPSIFISHYRKNYRILLKTLLFSITFIPTLIQWSLGSINNSGFVIAWVFLAPLGGLLFISEKAAKFWMIIFLLILGITLFVTPAFTADAVCIDSEIRNLFYLQNTGMVFSVIFILLLFFYRNLIAEKGNNHVAKELRQFIETANAPIFGIDSKGMVNEWNQTAAKITGFSKSEVLGQDLVKTYITEDYQEQVKQVLDNALKGEETANYEFPLFTKDDKRVMVLLNSSTRRDAEGNVVGVLGVGQDITEMDALRTSSESIAKELRQFIETANAPIFGIDSKGMVNEWNQTAAKITGFSKSEVLGQDLVKTYITEDYQEQVKQVLDNALKGEETANYEFPLFTKDDKRVMVLLNSSTRRDAEGNIVGVLGVGQDITGLSDYKEDLEATIIKNVNERTQELEASLEREKELGVLKSSFVSMASHQFRTPLTVIQSNTELLEMLNASGKEVAPEKHQKVTNRITAAIANMTDLMDDVLVLGKLSSGNVSFRPQECDLVDFCEKMAKEFTAVQTDGRRLDFEVKGKSYNVEIDIKLLGHSLSNLISNAFKYSIGKKNPDLTIHFKLNELVLSIKDYGIGIPENELPKLFEPFFRADNVTEIKGTGLGLSIAKEYVEVNKGTITATSILGEGSCFEITFMRYNKIKNN